jgi:hypothetical protein
MTVNIVVAHYDEDLSWVKNINSQYNVFIYSKTDKSYNFIEPNKGHEASVYLKYIVDHYNNLADKNLFLHGHQTSYHQSEPTDYICNNLNWSIPSYFSVNRRDWYFHEGVSDVTYPENYKWIKENWNYLFPKSEPIPKTFHHYSCAQFQCDKNNILRNSLQFYQNAYNWIMTTTLPNSQSGRIFEHIWPYIFTGKNIEPIIENIF